MVLQTHVADVQQRARFRVAHRIGLDILHIDGVGADLLGHHDAVALGGHRIGGEDLIVHLGVVLHAHIDVGAEASRRQHHGLAFHLGRIARHGILHFHARYGARIVGDQLDGLGVVDEHDVVHAVDTVGQLRGHLRPGMSDGDDGALDVVAAELHEVVLPGDAALVGEPVGRVERAVGDDGHQLRIALVVAADEHVGHEVLGAVLYALRHLDPVAGHRHFASREGRIATEDAHLVHKHDALALIGRRNGRRETGTARAYDHDVRLFRELNVAHPSGWLAILPIVRALPHRIQGAAHGGEEGHRGKRGAADGVYRKRLIVDDRLGHLLHGHIAHPRRLTGIEHGDAIDGAVFGRYLYRELAMLAHTGADSRYLAIGVLVVAGSGLPLLGRSLFMAHGRTTGQSQRASQRSKSASCEKLSTRTT